MIYARIGLGLGEPYSATLLIHPVSSEEEAMLPPAEEAPAAQAPAKAAPALPAMAMAAAVAPMGDVLEPDLSQLNSNRQAPDLPEEALQMPVSEASSEEKAVPVAA
jgi:hypothetical protein